MKVEITPAAFLTCLSLTLSLPLVHGWGSEGHEIVATIAQIYLHPTTHNAACRIIQQDANAGSCHLAGVATWADEIKQQPEYKFSKQLHFIGAVDDFPSKSCIFPGPRGWNSELNVVSGIKNTTTILLDYVEGKETGGRAEEALKFLIHFLGDMHQPFTCREGQSAETRLKLRSVAKRPVRLEPLFSKC